MESGQTGRSWLAATLLVLLAAAGCLVTDRIARQEQQRSEHLSQQEALRNLSNIRGELESRLSTALHLGTGIEAVVRANKGEIRGNEMREVLRDLRMLVDSELPDPMRDYARTARTSAEGLMGLLDDILDQSKIEVGHMTLERVEFELPELVQDVTELFTGTAHQKNLDLICAIDPALPARVVGDPTRLRQILVNLCSNAIKFTNTGFVRISVARSETNDDCFTFAVQDTGVGIETDIVPKLFQPFEQADSSTTRRYGGTGLGLAISRSLAQLMHGDIQVVSQVGVGTTFSATLQLETVGSARASDIPVLHDTTVLLACQQPEQRAAITAWLNAWGTPYREAADIDALADCLRQDANPEQLLILDTELRRQAEGHEVLHEELGRRAQCLWSLESQVTTKDARTTRIITLPLHIDALKRALQAHTEGRDPSAPLASQEHAGPEAQFPKTRVLVVDDNVINQRVVTAMLRRWQIDVDIAGDGQEAVAILSEHDYDLVLLDMQMPVMDGPQTARAIRSVDSPVRQHDVRIVALTANVSDVHRQQCYAAGMDGFLTKPLAKQRLLETLHEHLLIPAVT